MLFPMTGLLYFPSNLQRLGRPRGPRPSSPCKTPMRPSRWAPSGAIFGLVLFHFGLRVNQIFIRCSRISDDFLWMLVAFSQKRSHRFWFSFMAWQCLTSAEIFSEVWGSILPSGGWNANDQARGSHRWIGGLVDRWIGVEETDGNWLVLQVKHRGFPWLSCRFAKKKREKWSLEHPGAGCDKQQNCSGVQITQKRVSLNTTTFFWEKTSHRCWNPAAGLFVLCSPPGWSAPHFHRT